MKNEQIMYLKSITDRTITIYFDTLTSNEYNGYSYYCEGLNEISTRSKM